MQTSFAGRQEAVWRLRRNYKVLENQRLLLETLKLALDVQPGWLDWREGAEDILAVVGKQVFETCQQIATDSNLTHGLEADL